MDYETIIIILGIFSSIVSIGWFIWYCWDKSFGMRRINWKKAENAANHFIKLMACDGFSPSIIIGIGRGGAIMGSLVSGCLGHRPLLVIDRMYIWRDGRRLDDMLIQSQLPSHLLEKVLLIAGETHSGNTMRLYYDFLKEAGAKEIRRATFYYQIGCTEPVEYLWIKSSKELVLPWMFSKEYIRNSRSNEQSNLLSYKKLKEYHELDSELLGNCFLVRHGQSADNAVGDRYSGVTDSLLTEQGQHEAKDTGRALQNEQISTIYCSPMKRAVETARIVQIKTGGMIIIDRRLREIDYGDWEGLTRQDVFQRWPDLYNAYRTDPIKNHPPSGESLKKIQARIKSFWGDLEKIITTNHYQKIVLVTHKSIGRLLLCHITGKPLSAYRTQQLDNGSITKIIFKKTDGIKIEYQNNTDHLTNQT